MMRMRFLLLASAMTAVTVAIVWQAYTLKQQFYPTVVYLTRSNRTMAILYAEALILVVAFGRLLSKIFFGHLRFAEVEHLRERLWYAVTEGCLIFAVLRDDIGVRFVALLGMLLFLKCFHWLIEERTDYMERSTAITKMFHLRMLSLFNLLIFADSCMLNASMRSMLSHGSLMQLVFAFEYAILLLTLIGTLVRYVLHTIDKRYENAWEAKSGYLLYADLVISAVRVTLYGLFIFVMSNMRTLPLFCIRQAYLSVRAFRKALSDIVLSRRAIRNMNTLYVSPTLDELRATDATCIICREDMLAGATATATTGSSVVASCKKLPCGHVFHVACLRSWFQRQQSCPTCRLDVIRNAQPGAPGANVAPPAPNRNQQPAQAPAGRLPDETTLPAGTAGLSASAASSHGVPPFGFPFPFLPNVAGSALPSSLPLGGMPLLPPVLCICPPFAPPPAPSLTGLSDAELRELEGTERAALQARIECLRNIQTLLDAAMMQFTQYSAVVNQNSTMPPQPVPTPTTTTTEEQRTTL